MCRYATLRIPLRVLLAVQPELVTPVLQVLQRAVTWHPLDHACLESTEGHGAAVTLIQRSGPVANRILNCAIWCWMACTWPAWVMATKLSCQKTADRV
jgi:hypothetical protein